VFDILSHTSFRLNYSIVSPKIWIFVSRSPDFCSERTSFTSLTSKPVDPFPPRVPWPTLPISSSSS
jgi:hypothetical protein